jgi:hypothetical protein
MAGRNPVWLIGGAALVVSGVGALAPAAAQVSLAPVVDRWVYPFANTPGNRATVPIYGTGGDARFDDRDSEFYLAFPTAAAVPTGLAPGMYRVQGATLRLQIAEDLKFEYDPTSDPASTYPLNGTDPGTDSDPGRPIEVFGADFRNGFNLFSFSDLSPFKPGQPFTPPWVGVRNTFPIDFGPMGDGPARDVSSNVRGGFDAQPLAVGLTTAASPGDLVPADAVFTFALDTALPGPLGYLQTGLARGRIALAVTSMQVATEFGSGPIVYPVFYTSKAPALGFPNAITPTLELTATACPADYNADGLLNLDDLGDFITDFYLAQPIPGGVQPAAPTYAGQWVGFSVPCPTAPDAAAPYAVDAYRTRGYRVGFSADGSGSCPIAADQAFPNLDNLGDFITRYYESVTSGGC